MITIELNSKGMYRIKFSETDCKDLTRKEIGKLVEAIFSAPIAFEPIQPIVIDPRQAHTADPRQAKPL